MKRAVLSLGVGTQSTDLLFRGLRGEFDTKPELAIFSDTGCEPKAVYKYLDWLQEFTLKEFHFEITVLQEANIYEDALTYLRSGSLSSDGIPYHIQNLQSGKKGILKRQCTYDYKIAPVRRHIRKHIGKLEPMELWLGISYDELQRMKISDVKWLEHRYPLIDKRLTRLDAIKNFKAHNLPIPSRSSCIVCPYHSNGYWYWLYTSEPESFEAAVALDEKIRFYPGVDGACCYLHHSCRPLSEIITKIVADKALEKNQLALFPELIDECDGVCGN